MHFSLHAWKSVNEASLGAWRNELPFFSLIISSSPPYVKHFISYIWVGKRRTRPTDVTGEEIQGSKQHLVAARIASWVLPSGGLRHRPYSRNNPQPITPWPATSKAVTSHFEVRKKLHRNSFPFLKSEELMYFQINSLSPNWFKLFIEKASIYWVIHMWDTIQSALHILFHIRKKSI